MIVSIFKKIVVQKQIKFLEFKLSLNVIQCLNLPSQVVIPNILKQLLIIKCFSHDFYVFHKFKTF